MKEIKYPYPFKFINNNKSEYPIVFAHGFNSSINCLDIFANNWKDNDFYAISFPGNQGLKPIENHEISVYQYAQLLAQFIIDNDLKNVILIGHSMGGGTISLAYELVKDRISKMIYLAPMNKTSLPKEEVYFDTYFPRTFNEFITKFIPVLYYDASIFTNDSQWMKENKKNFKVSDHINDMIMKLGESLPDPKLMNDIEMAMKKITVPSMLIMGEKDGVMKRDNCLEYFKKTIKNVETYWIKKTGHMMFDEDFDTFKMLLKNFINKK
ncbi:alpha/beta fold hydrolase [Mycoplasma phocoenae]|uniref:Alpha/beta hydrolase n=1 Tax=Mycoplasma phocoenae TaxID=754517 RepID=A0A858U1Q6_9MOLU|nr:alpha/beta hydrolase [Mycoplasma phocoenae]QJG67054.1 alpha/beta hydrolase [Mycoplasma phocoenae]